MISLLGTNVARPIPGETGSNIHGRLQDASAFWDLRTEHLRLILQGAIPHGPLQARPDVLISGAEHIIGWVVTPKMQYTATERAPACAQRCSSPALSFLTTLVILLCAHDSSGSLSRSRHVGTCIYCLTLITCFS